MKIIRPLTLLTFSASLSLQAAQPEYVDQPQLHDIAANVSAQRIEQDIEKLVSFGTRHTLSETESDTRGIGAARRWIKAEFERIACSAITCLNSLFSCITNHEFETHTMRTKRASFAQSVASKVKSKLF